MSLYATCPCGIPEGLDMVHLRTDCPHYGSTPPSPAPTVTGEIDLASLAIQVLRDYRRRDGLTSYAYDENRKRDEAYMQASFEAIVRPALAALTQPTPPAPAANEARADVVVTAPDVSFSEQEDIVQLAYEMWRDDNGNCSMTESNRDNYIIRASLRQQAGEVEALKLSNAVLSAMLKSEEERAQTEQHAATKAEAENVRLREAARRVLPFMNWTIGRGASGWDEIAEFMETIQAREQGEAG